MPEECITCAGDTAWLLMATALVMFMTPGLACSTAGSSVPRTCSELIMQSFIALGVVTVLWMLIGYTLAFGPDTGSGIIGGLDFLWFEGVGQAPSELGYSPTTPHNVFAMYQMMFAIITPALISGAIAERIKFGGYVLFISLWSLLIYAPVAHWVFADGWLGLFEGNLGALDFAGGTVVHINAGAAALACTCTWASARGTARRRSFPTTSPWW